ncbi:hypothetical protein BDV33DRAFT_202525 [Aspergillus novoparasiticus]|uniref:Uncharacterized protein n=1 Tax=Aspergillus novoparasiticus TaxID=986946 RepID=A0A5N6EW63_9EURO|nr:hypothetical protein BDV33DRAFT_202525 [Aspergillus novoparasiticus]
MFAALPPMQQFNFSQCATAPARPSPLSPHSSPARPMPSLSSSPFHLSPASESQPNTPVTSRTDSGSLFLGSPVSPSPSKGAGTSSRSKTSPTYAQRYASTISNPLNNASRNGSASSSPSAREARRKVFLNRIKQGRDDARFANRGEQLALMELVAEQKKWGESMRRRTDGILQGYLRDLEEGVDDMLDEAGIQALDEYLSQEQAMEMELLENVDAQTPSKQDTGNASKDPGSSFSDDEYEDIFVDLADQTALSQDMDMSG